MSSLVLKQLPLLELLTKVNGKSRQKILKCCDLDLIEAIAECIFNVLRKNIQLKKTHINKLKKHKTTLRRLVNPKNKLNRKRNTFKNEEIVVDDDYQNSIFSASTVEVVDNDIEVGDENMNENQQTSANNVNENEVNENYQNNGDNREGERIENNGDNPEGLSNIQREIFTLGFHVKVVLDAYILPRK